MKHFNFNKLSPCMWDSKKASEYIFCPESTSVGEIVTIGRSKKLMAIYIPCEVRNDDFAISCTNDMPDAININLPPDADKMIQYVASIKGYLFGYLFMA